MGFNKDHCMKILFPIAATIGGCLYGIFFLKVLDVDYGIGSAHTSSHNSDRINILLLCYAGSGSASVYTAMHAHPLTFGVNEPFFSLVYGSTLNKKGDTIAARIPFDKTTASKHLQEMFDCEYRNLGFLFHTMFDHRMEMFNSITKNWNSMGRQPKYVNRICKSAYVNLIKTVTIDFDVVETLFKTYAGSSTYPLKVVHLVRDPRGIIGSRKRMETFNDPLSLNATVVCGNMWKNMDTFEKLRVKYPGHFIQIKYEDFAKDSLKTVKSIYEFSRKGASWDVNGSYVDKLKQSQNISGVKSLTENDKTIVNDEQWKDTLKVVYVTIIENYCPGLMVRLGYKPLPIKD